MTRPPGDFPTLAAFFAGYLHEDFVAVHATPSAALDSFVRDAGPEQAERLAREWSAWAERSRGLSLADLREAIGQLGGAWHPARRRDVARLRRHLERLVASAR